jgi:hypothetical protein
VTEKYSTTPRSLLGLSPTRIESKLSHALIAKRWESCGISSASFGKMRISELMHSVIMYTCLVLTCKDAFPNKQVRNYVRNRDYKTDSVAKKTQNLAMSTRSRTRQASAATTAAAPAKEAAVTKKATRVKKDKDTNEGGDTLKVDADAVPQAKTNGRSRARTSKAGTSGKAASKKNGKIYCTCKKGDDGTPMVYCAECNDWYASH